MDIQSDLLEEMQTRVVVPLTKAPAFARRPVAYLMPTVRFEDDVYVLMTPHLAGIPRAELGQPAGSLMKDRDAIISAIDFLLSGV